MLQNNTMNTISGNLILDKGDWLYITSAPFYSLEENIIITWESLDPNIAQINPNSGLLYAKTAGETTVIGVSSEETILVLCSIQVNQNAALIATAAINAPNTSILTMCIGNNSNNVSAMGYSGTIFAYKMVGSRVTLEKGFGAKNGTSNSYSNLFRSALIRMNNIYASMSPDQRSAWMELRASGILSDIASMLTSTPSDYIIGLVKDELVDYFLPVDEIEALLSGFYSWYSAEQNAISYYKSF